MKIIKQNKERKQKRSQKGKALFYLKQSALCRWKRMNQMEVIFKNKVAKKFTSLIKIIKLNKL